MLDDEALFEAARNSSSSVGEYESSVAKKGVSLSMIIGMVVCGLTTITEYAICHRWDFGKFVILFSVCSVIYLYEGIKTHNRRMIIPGIFYLVIDVFSIILFIGALFI